MGTVTELAILTLTPGTSTSTLELVNGLKKAKKVQETASGYPAHYYTQVEDPSNLYVIGSWRSSKTHMDFLPSQENQGVIKLLSPYIRTDNMVMFHVDVDISSDIAQAARSTSGRFPADVPILAIGRYTMSSSPDARESFAMKFGQQKLQLEADAAPYGVFGGFRIEKEESPLPLSTDNGNEVSESEAQMAEEFVLFSGSEDADVNMEPAKTDMLNKYDELQEWVEVSDIKHARRIEL